MTSDTHLAFEHPEARAAATSGDMPLDRISLRDHVIEVDIGAFQSERGVRQRVSFNIVVELEPVSGPVEDDVDRILSYDKLTEAIQNALDSERVNLLETLAERVADLVLLEPRAHRVFVRIEKLDRGPGALGVEIVRASDAHRSAAAEMEQPAPHPLICHLGAEAVKSPRLSTWLDALDADPRPVILTVGLPETEWPASGMDMTQRRIELLAIEQNAWALAARDPRCVVRASRTELDWAMKTNQMSVWAPSKMVLDAVHGPTGDAGSLVAWLADELEANELVVIGDPAPESASAEVRVIAADADLTL